MRTLARKMAVATGLALTMACAGLAPAAVASPNGSAHPPRHQKTIHVSGDQFAVPGSATEWTMEGDLVGDWKTFPVAPPLHNSATLFSEAGTEVFIGCIDRKRDGYCGPRDYRGEFHAVYLSWASFDLDGNFLKGQCVHPITGGNGAFTGARGVISMFDTPVDGKIETKYRGNVVLSAVPSEPPTPPLATTAAPNKLKAAAPSTRRAGC